MSDSVKNNFGILSILLVVVYLLVLLTVRTSHSIHTIDIKVRELSDDIEVVTETYENQIDSLKAELERYEPETLWLARAVYSETDRLNEMKYVAWVIRNRVELKYNGKSTYKEVILDSNQFSAFNTGSPNRWYYLRKSVTDTGDMWINALKTAHEVRTASPDLRPFPILTTHFYSPISMTPPFSMPMWARTMEQIRIQDVEENRFRFFKSGSSIN